MSHPRTIAALLQPAALLLFSAFLAPVCACTSDDPAEPIVEPQEPVTYPLDDATYTVLQAVWEPLVPSADTRARIDAGELSVTDIEAFEGAGLGVRLAEGLSWLEHDELAPDFDEGVDRRSVAYVWQAADPQLIDEESPIRFEAFDKIYRPHGHLTTQVFESHVRTAQRLSDASGRPFDFALMAGDITDGSQQNELGWFATIMAGGVIDPDTGADDDPRPGPGNDHGDPFLSDGLAVPWYAAIGNHETLYNGGFGPITDDLRAAAAGEAIYQFPLFDNGFRDGSTVHADVVSEGTTVADPERVPQRLDEVLAWLHDAPGEPVGHGLTPDDVAAGRGYFSVAPIPDRPVRLITLDTIYSESQTAGLGSLGYLDVEQHAWLEEMLTEADLAGELVIVMSHHRAEDFGDNSPVSGEQLRATLRANAGVVLHVTGHGHRNEQDLVPTMDVEGGYWELMLASTVDFPMQSRVIEIVDERNGFLSIYVTNVDHNAPESSLAHEARALAAAKRAFGTVSEEGDVAGFWEHDVEAQNLLLRVAIDEGLAESLAASDFPTRIESLQTLAALGGP
jgi:3',5'-cyclic AMP phosphodiesterase CpdA